MPSSGRLGISGSAAYICPRCTTRRAARTAQSLHSSQEYTGRPKSIRQPVVSLRVAQYRSFSHTNGHPAVEEATHQSRSIEAPPIDLLRDFDTSLGQESPKKSSIREQLRQWSEQNQKAREAGVNTAQPLTRSTAVLPSTIYGVDDEDSAKDEDEDDADQFAEFEDMIEGDHRTLLEPGDLVRFSRTKGRATLALFVGSTGHQNQFVLSSGRWVTDSVARPSALAVLLREFVTAAELEPLRPFFPKSDFSTLSHSGVEKQVHVMGELPPDLVRPLVRKFTRVWEGVIEFQRAHVGILDLIWDKTSHEEEYRFMTIEDIAAIVLGETYSQMTDGGKICLFRSISKDSSRILPNRDPRTTSMTYIMVPKNAQSQYETVTEWARQYQECAANAAMGKNVASALRQNPLNAFIDKARRLILLSRKTRSPTTIGILGPSSIKGQGDDIPLSETGETFSENDKMILEFLWATYLRKPAPKNRTTQQAVGSLILRAIGAYPRQKLEDRIARLLLQEMGALAPWAEHPEEDLRYQIPGHRGAHTTDVVTRRSEDLALSMGFSATSAEQGPTSMPDGMAHLREDFEPIALSIDPAGAALVDDAVSLETDAENPTQHWIHIHVAHPSAYISPDHPLAKRARQYGFALYTQQTVYPLMPWGVGKAMSLDINGRALTVSVKLSETGSILEVKIRPTIVKNVVRLNKQAVQKLMGQQDAEMATFIIGQDTYLSSIEQTKQEDIAQAKKYLPVLQKLQDLVLSRIRARRSEVPEYATYEELRTPIDVRVSTTEPFDSNRLHRSYHYQGDPTIRIDVNRYMPRASRVDLEEGDDLTTNLMKLGAETAGLWFKERGLPGIFAGAQTDPAFPLWKLNSLKPWEEPIMPKTTFTPYPHPHVFLNIMQYIRCTSPLRRWGDLVNTWQIDAFLRAEAEGKVTSDAPVEALGLPFTYDQIQTEIDDYYPKIVNENLQRMSRRHWIFQALFRAFHFKEAKLPRVWDCRLDRPEGYHLSDPQDSMFRGTLYPLCVPAYFDRSDGGWEKSTRWKQYIPCEIVLVDVGGRFVRVRAIGPGSDTETQRDPIYVSSQTKNGDNQAMAGTRERDGTYV